MAEYESKYMRKGVTNVGVGAMISLVVGVGVAVLILIFVGTLGGQTYNTAQTQINAINDTTIKGYVTGSVTSGFSALKQTADYIPLIVLAVIIFVVLALVLALPGIGGNSGGSAL